MIRCTGSRSERTAVIALAYSYGLDGKSKPSVPDFKSGGSNQGALVPQLELLHRVGVVVKYPLPC